MPFLFHADRRVEGELIDLLGPRSRNQEANSLYRQIRLSSRDSKVPQRCTYWGKDFALKNLPEYRRRCADGPTGDISCPHYKSAQAIALTLADIKDPLVSRLAYPFLAKTASRSSKPGAPKHYLALRAPKSKIEAQRVPKPSPIPYDI